MRNYDHDTSTTDSELVARSLAGERNAYGTLVSRHQAAACAVAYGACGDFQLSEDAAQEAFVTGWKQLKELRARDHFRPWLCGIARNIARNKARKSIRRGEAVEPVAGMGDIADDSATPAAEAITGEESALVWHTVDALEEGYREPLILFYREQQSVSAVASALELSEEAVRQRLVRGRALLREELARQVEAAFLRTRPGSVFTLGVMSALPPILAGGAVALSAGSAKAATSVAGGAKAGAVGLAAASAAAAPVASALVGGAGFVLLFRTMFSPHIPKEFRRVTQKCMAVALGSSAIFTVWILWMARTNWRHAADMGFTPAGLLTLSVAIFSILNLIYPLIIARRLHKKLERRGLCAGSSGDMPYRKRYESKARFLGLPLVSVSYGADYSKGETRKAAKGWIAFGETAYGFFACGSLGVGVVSVGGVSFGLLSLGGIAIGPLCFGGAAFGLFACGCVSVGLYYAIGGICLAYHVAMGGIAMAAHAAFGGSAFAEYANNGAEWERLTTQTRIGDIIRILPHLGWLSLLGLPGLWMAFREVKRKRL